MKNKNLPFEFVFDYLTPLDITVKPMFGMWAIYVNDKNNCGVVFETFYALSYPKFFTPNGDNYNDTWQIKNLDKKGLEHSKLTIFDRFGKLLKQIKQ